MKGTVAHTLPDFAHGGGQMLLWRTISELPDFRHVVVARADGPMADEFVAIGAEVSVFDGSTPAAVIEMTRLIRSADVDIVHTNNTPADRLCGQLAALATSTRVINTFHSFPTEGTGAKKRLQRLANRVLCRAGRPRLLAVSDQCRRAYVEVMGLDDADVTVQYPGITDNFFAPAGEPNPPLPTGTISSNRRAGAAGVTDATDQVEEILRLISVCRLTGRKGVGTVIDSFARIAGDHPHAELVIVGDGVERERLGDEAERLGVADRVRFLGHRSDVAALLQASDVYVTATETEGFGMSVVEAMACGLPIVAMELPVWVEFLSVDNALVASSTEQLSQHLATLMNDAARRRQLGARAKADAEAFRIAARARDLGATYDEVIGADTTLLMAQS